MGRISKHPEPEASFQTFKCWLKACWKLFYSKVFFIVHTSNAVKPSGFNYIVYTDLWTKKKNLIIFPPSPDMFISSNFSLHYLWGCIYYLLWWQFSKCFPAVRWTHTHNGLIICLPPLLELWQLPIFFLLKHRQVILGHLLLHTSAVNISRTLKKKGFIHYFIFYGLFCGLSLLQYVSLFLFSSLPFTCETKVWCWAGEKSTVPRGSKWLRFSKSKWNASWHVYL